MENIKSEGTQGQAVKSLTVPMTMLELGKFREAELMAEQYLLSNNEDAMGYLVLYASKVKSKNLHKYKKGDRIDYDVENTLYLYAEHREILKEFFLWGENTAIRNVLFYLQAYIKNASSAMMPINWSTEEGDTLADFCNIILNVLFSYNKKEFGELSYWMGNLLLRLGAYAQAKGFFLNASEQEYNVAESLLHVLFCEMQIRDESEFATCERFSVEMPEYINLLLAIGENREMLNKVNELVEQNQSQRDTVVEQRMIEENRKRYEKYGKKEMTPLHVLSIVFFWIFTGVSLFYFLFLYDDGLVWDTFVKLTPFGQFFIEGQIRVSLVTSTIVLILEQIIFLVVWCMPRYEDGIADTVRKRVFWIATHTSASFVAWYTMYGYALWFENWVGFFTVIVSLVFALILCAVIIFAFLGVGMSVHFMDTKLQTFAGGAWLRAYNREYVAIFFLSFGAFMVVMQKFDFLCLLVMAYFLVLGLYFLVVTIKNRYASLFMLANTETLVTRSERNIMISTESGTGLAYMIVAPAFALFFHLAGLPLFEHLVFDALVFLLGGVHFVFAFIAEKRYL